MFTGIIEELGIVQAFRPASGSASLTVEAPGIAIGMKPGDSIAVNGVCLTVTRANDRDFSFDLSAETLRRSSLGRLQRGMSVNLERPLAVGDRLGGHFVLGHVDGVGNLSTKVRSGDGCVLAFRFPRDLARYLVLKGSVAVDGISLTIASLEQESFSAAIIPHTLEVTNLKTLGPGDEVNLEVDILGKYFERFFQLGLLQERAEGLTFDYLRDQGF